MDNPAFNPPPPTETYEFPNFGALKWLIKHPQFVNAICNRQKENEALKSCPSQVIMNHNLLSELIQYRRRYKKAKGVQVTYKYAQLLVSSIMMVDSTAAPSQCRMHPA